MLLHYVVLFSFLSFLSLIHAGDLVLQCHTIKNYIPIRPLVPHCLLAIRLITSCSDKSHAPMQFSTTTTGFVVPHTWRHGTCEVEIKPVDPSGAPEDTFTLYDVGDHARDVVAVCINSQRFRYGGRVTVGPKNDFWVSVSSTNVPEETPSRFASNSCFWT